jgi:hypothetical protein
VKVHRTVLSIFIRETAHREKYVIGVFFQVNMPEMKRAANYDCMIA